MSFAIARRPATDHDRGFLERVYASTREVELAAVPWSAAEKTAFLRQQFKTQHEYYRQVYPDAEYSILTCEGQDIGRLYVARLERETVIVDIALLPSWRGRGLGTQILSGLLAEAASMGRPVTLHVEKNNPAVRLYRRLGFSEAEDQGVYTSMRWSPWPSAELEQKDSLE
jgi:ribosomal protein S18 acetylase RimI-like enzyme